MKLNGKRVTSKNHTVGPYTIERVIEEEVEVDVLDADGEPTGEKTTEVQKVKKVFGIYAQPVWSYKEFEDRYGIPEPPLGGWSPKTGEKKKNYRDPQYLQDLDRFSQAREGWTILKSIGPPSKLELDGVSLDDPTTWPDILKALRFDPETGEGLFSYFEYNEVVKLVDEACGIDNEKLKENRESFLSEQQAQSSEPTKR